MYNVFSSISPQNSSAIPPPTSYHYPYTTSFFSLFFFKSTEFSQYCQYVYECKDIFVSISSLPGATFLKLCFSQ